MEYVLNTKNNNIKDAILSDLDNIKKDVVVPSVEPVVEKPVYNNNHTGIITTVEKRKMIIQMPLLVERLKILLPKLKT